MCLAYLVMLCSPIGAGFIEFLIGCMSLSMFHFSLEAALW